MRWEARTMRSGTSYFNFAVWKKTFLRFWPLWAANLTVWMLVFPLNGLMMLRRGSDNLASMTHNLMRGTGSVIAVGAVVLSVMVAMAVCSHLYNSRSANFFGAFPVKREGLFLSVYLAGIAMLMLPNLVIFVLMLLLELAGDALCMTQLLFWLAAVCGMELFFFSFAVFCGMFAGHILALPVYYGVFNVLALAIYGLIVWTLGEFYYGFDSTSLDYWTGELVRWLTPVWALSEVGCHRVFDETVYFAFEGTAELIVYAIAGLVLAVGALLLYKFRHMETAGDIVAVKPMRPVFKYGVAVCAGFLFGFATWGILGLGRLGLSVAIVLWGVAGCFVAQMLLDKTVKVFYKWKGPAVLAAVFILLFAAVACDFTGFETRIPTVDSIQYAEVSGLSSWPNDDASYWDDVRVDDPEDLALVTGLHAMALEERDDGVARPRPYSGDECYWNFRVTYHLKNGSIIARRYLMQGSGADVNREGTTAWTVQQLVNDRELVRRAYRIDEAEELLAKGGRLTGAALEPAYDWSERAGYPDGAYTYDGVEYAALPRDSDSSVVRYYYGQDAMALWEAVLADLDAGAIGERQAARYDEEPAMATLRFDFEIDEKAQPGDGALSQSVTWSMNIGIALSPDADGTWAVLERLPADAG